MFLLARYLFWLAVIRLLGDEGHVLYPVDQSTREIAEAFVLDGESPLAINIFSLKMWWYEARKQEPIWNRWHPYIVKY